MKIKNSSPNKRKKIILLIVIVVVLLGGYTAYAAAAQMWPFSSSNNTKQVNTPNDQVDSSGKNPDLQKQDSTTTDDQSSPKAPVQNSPGNTTTPTTKVNVTITSVIISGSNLKVSSLIEAVTNNGTCTLTLTKDGQTITKAAEIQALPSSSTCKGFNVPLSQLSSGVWHLTLAVNTDNKTGSVNRNYTVR